MVTERSLLLSIEQDTCWDNPVKVREVETELQNLGYTPLATVSTPAMRFVKMKAFANTTENAYAILYDEPQSTWVDFFSVASDGAASCFSATNAPAPRLGFVDIRPVYFSSYQLPKVAPTLLHQEFLRLRPDEKWDAVSLQSLPGAYQRLCEADSAWRQTHLSGNDTERKMVEIVRKAYDQTRELRCKNPVEELFFVLRDLRLPDDTVPKMPISITAAAMDGNLEMVKEFLEDGADINEKSRGYASPLAAAALCGQAEVIVFLLQEGADPTQAQFPMTSAIANAAKGGYTEIVKTLLKWGKIPNKQKTAAYNEAKARKYEAIANLLRERPASGESLWITEITARKARQKEVSEMREMQEREDISLLLMGKEPVPPPFRGAARHSATERPLKLLADEKIRAHVDVPDKEFGSYLQLAVATGSVELVQAVLDANPAKESISSALIGAAEIGSIKIVNLLLGSGADPNFTGYAGWTALMSAARAGDIEVVQRLLAAGANPAAKTEAKEAAAMFAAGPFQNRIKALLNSTAAPAVRPRPGQKAILSKGKKKLHLSTAKGAGDFKNAIGQPDWSLICIEAAPGEVSAAFAKIHPAAKWHGDTGGRRLIAKTPSIFIFRLRGHAWTILLRTVGWLGMEDINALPEDARKLSEYLKTRAITYIAEDTSGSEGYELFEHGQSIEQATWTGEADFKSSQREQPDFDESFPDPTFSELGIYLPACWFANDGDAVKLVLNGIPAEAVERLDCFELNCR